MTCSQCAKAIPVPSDPDLLRCANRACKEYFGRTSDKDSKACPHREAKK